MTSIVWVEQEWTDSKLKWEPADYGGVTKVNTKLITIHKPRHLSVLSTNTSKYNLHPVAYSSRRFVETRLSFV